MWVSARVLCPMIGQHLSEHIFDSPTSTYGRVRISTSRFPSFQFVSIRCFYLVVLFFPPIFVDAFWLVLFMFFFFVCVCVCVYVFVHVWSPCFIFFHFIPASLVWFHLFICPAFLLDIFVVFFHTSPTVRLRSLPRTSSFVDIRRFIIIFIF